MWNDFHCNESMRVCDATSCAMQCPRRKLPTRAQTDRNENVWGVHICVSIHINLYTYMYTVRLNFRKGIRIGRSSQLRHRARARNGRSNLFCMAGEVEFAARETSWKPFGPTWFRWGSTSLGWGDHLSPRGSAEATCVR